MRTMTIIICSMVEVYLAWSLPLLGYSVLGMGNEAVVCLLF